MAGPRRRNHAALHGRHRLATLENSDGELAPKKESAESRKRRTRHEIWDAEDTIAEWEARITNLQREQALLKRKLELMVTTVRIREAQVARLQQFGVCDSAASSKLLQSSTSHVATSGVSSFSNPLTLAACTPDTSSSYASSAVATPSHVVPALPCTPRPGDGSIPDSIFDFSLEQLDELTRALVSGSSSLDGEQLVSSTLHAPPTAPAVQLSPSPASSCDTLDMARIITQAQNAGPDGLSQDALERELSQWSEHQIIDAYKQASGYLSQLLFAAEDMTSPAAAASVLQLSHVMNAARRLGAIAKVCNPALVRVVSQPVSAGLEHPSEQHWDAVVRALLLTPRQVEDGAILNDMRLKWLHRIGQDHAVVSRVLSEVLTESEQRWRATCDRLQVRKAEMMNKLQRVIGAERWVLVLIDELLTEQILDNMQLARCLVHSYPYVPDACAIVDAMARLHSQRQAAEEDTNNLADAHISRPSPCSRAVG